MRRRTFLKYLTGGSATTALGGAAWLSWPRDHSHLAIDLTLEKLETLDLAAIQKDGAWDVARTFNHLAQSIDFSMTGYPEPKSPLFQNTVGKLAFNVFQARGRMSHDLGEAIPGEKIAVAPVPDKAALDHLKQTLITFQQTDGPLQPHFVFGALSKEDYALAHVMHINNHLEEFRVA